MVQHKLVHTQISLPQQGAGALREQILLLSDEAARVFDGR